MTKLGNDTAPESGKGTDADRLSESPLSIRRGDADRPTSARARCRRPPVS
jgi:hypothetical protein